MSLEGTQFGCKSLARRSNHLSFPVQEMGNGEVEKAPDPAT